MADVPAALYSSFARAVSAGSDSRLSILIFHRVLRTKDDFRRAEPDVSEFEWQMRLISRFFRPLSLADALRHLDADSLPPMSVCVTFDDGYANNLTEALPILQKYAIPATVFVTTSFLDGGCMWNDAVIEALRHCRSDSISLHDFGLSSYSTRMPAERRAAAYQIINAIKYFTISDRMEVVNALKKLSPASVDGMMLSPNQLRELHRAGVEIGAHTVSHPILETLSESDAEFEVTESKRRLERELGTEVRFFAYPNGRFGVDYSSRHVGIVKNAGFRAALTTNWGVSNAQTSRHEIPRFTPWDKQSARYLLRMATNLRNIR